MISVDVAVAFSFASLILALVPGPDNIFVLTQSALLGRRSGLVVTLGLCTGLIFHSCAVALGVAVIFQTSILAFTVLKYVGAAYLTYLAYLSFSASIEKIEGGKAKLLSYKRLYFRGIVMNVTNPKVSIFFLAFLPQFVDPARGTVSMQVLTLGFLFMISTVVVFGSVAFLAGTLGPWLNRSGRTQLFLNKTVGVVFVGLAIKLASTTQ